MSAATKKAERALLAEVVADLLASGVDYTSKAQLYADLAVKLGCTPMAAELRCRRFGPELPTMRRAKGQALSAVSANDSASRLRIAAAVAKRYAYRWRWAGLVEFGDLLGCALLGIMEGERAYSAGKSEQSLDWWRRRWAAQSCIAYCIDITCPVKRYSRPTSNEQRRESMRVGRGELPDAPANMAEQRRSVLLNWIQQGVQTQMGIFANKSAGRARVVSYLFDDSDSKTMDKSNGTARAEFYRLRSEIAGMRELAKLYNAADWLHA